jgi:GH24 family phage-related lysozyme (muramidase)
MIRPSVLEKWPAFTLGFEGRVFTMYADVRGLITTGMGNLIDPLRAALALKWRYPDGGLAPASQIEAEWTRLKSFGVSMGKHNPDTQARLAGLTLHLPPEDVDALVREKCEANAEFMRAHYFPDWDAWPADAQLGALSEAWAAGAGFPSTFHTFTAAAKKQDWIHAASECKSRVMTPEGITNAGVIPRNEAQMTCFRNAAAVAASVGVLDPAVCYWPELAAGDK